MIFIIDPNGNSAAGDSIQNAWEVYDHEHGDFAMKELRFFEGIEVEVEFVVKPKVKKSK